MKDHGHPLRKVGRGHARRTRRGNLERLELEFATNDGSFVTHDRRVRSAMHTLSERNWRVHRQGREVVAIEPGRDFETPFRGPTAFWDAVEFAAGKLKGVTSDGRPS